MELKIFPYTKKDGIRTQTDSFLQGLYDRMVTDRSAGIVFSTSSIKYPIGGSNTPTQLIVCAP